MKFDTRILSFIKMLAEHHISDEDILGKAAKEVLDNINKLKIFDFKFMTHPKRIEAEKLVKKIDKGKKLILRNSNSCGTLFEHWYKKFENYYEHGSTYWSSPVQNATRDEIIIMIADQLEMDNPKEDYRVGYQFQ